MSFVDEGFFNFAVELYKTMELYKENPTSNVLVSPFLLSNALVALLNGAKDNTAVEIAEALFGKTLSTNEYKEVNQKLGQLVEKALKPNGKVISAANFIYANSKFPVAGEFQKVAESAFAVKIRPLDSTKIQKDISDSTNGKVANFNASFSSSDGIVLASAFHAKGVWKLQFNPTDIKKDKFKTASGEQVEVDMMYESNKYRTSYNDELKCNCIELAYENSNVVMILLKPYTNSSLEELGFSVDSNLINEAINSMSQPIKTDLYLPKFKLEATTHLQTFVDKLNIKDIFNKDAARLPGILKDGMCLAVGDIVQKCSVEVDEQGVSQELPTAFQFKPKEFRLNRPFMVMLVARPTPDSGVILFTGAVNNPLK